MHRCESGIVPALVSRFCQIQLTILVLNAELIWSASSRGYGLWIRVFIAFSERWYTQRVGGTKIMLTGYQ